jgi:hypothetical protein
MMNLRPLAAALALSLSVCAGGALAQGASAPAAAASSAASAASNSSPAKRDLAKRWVALQQASLDAAARSIVEAPARQLLGAADPVLRSKVPADKREAVAKQLQDEARKYADDLTPVVRKRAQELAQTQMLAAVEEKYTEDELRQVVGFYESPVFKKLQQTQPPIEQALGQKLLAGVQPTVETKAKALQATMAKILGVSPAPVGGGASAPAGSGLKPSAPKKLGAPSTDKP